MSTVRAYAVRVAATLVAGGVPSGPNRRAPRHPWHRSGLDVLGRIYVYSHAYAPLQDEGYDVDVPNKTIYVSEGDLKLYQRAQAIAGGNLSSAIAQALRRYVDIQEGLREGFDDVVVRVGIGSGKKVRFTGQLVGERALDLEPEIIPAASHAVAFVLG